MKNINFDQIQPEDTVRLRWLGDRRIPITLNHEWATIIRRNKVGNFVIKCSHLETGERTITTEHIMAHKAKE